ncbi:MAG: LutB/LldF family L-lactate oxidation iron-sulfur protein [Desulforhopalus sp.]|nr:LutB/LldF family L-lactate oxidation iron-sulfur protein [Desulforhopalus sp.]
MSKTTPIPPSDYRTAAAAGIASPRLQKSLQGIQNRFGKGAMEFWAKMDDQELRHRVKESRMNTLAHLDIVLAELAKNIRARGGQVYFAATAQDAIDYTLAVAKKNNVKRVVKGKSMTSAEIAIDPALEEAGIEVVETDLGEYIIQLAGDKPSHIIAPCIHLDRAQIGQLFTDKLGIDYSDDPPTLTMAARKALREKMLGAEMGLTGCNLACAETGHISLVSNEGNIRMATTMPDVHVALMGMERVVATFDEHRETLQLLTRGAALQKLSTYVSFQGGPAALTDPDGPREFHLVIIDNGRSKILADPEFREVLACIRCGACLNICPVYGKIGGHAYDSPYCGPIGAVVTPLLDGINKHADLCKGETLCGACRDVCPVENDLPRMLAALRHKLAYGSDRWNTSQHNPAEAYAFALWKLLVSHPVLYRTSLWFGKLFQWPFVRKNKMIGSLAGLATGWTKDRDLPPLAGQTFAQLWKKKYAARRPNESRAQSKEAS